MFLRALRASSTLGAKGNGPAWVVRRTLVSGWGKKSKTRLGFSKFESVSGMGKAKVGSSIVTDPALCGEDSFFIEESMMSSVGVADGVGGWQSEGVDPGKIARSIMSNCAHFASEKYAPPTWLLAEAYYKVKYAKEVEAGSTTACICSLREVQDEGGSARLIVFGVNLGDSGAILVRNGKIVERSPFQQNYGAPNQLAVIPESLRSKGFIQNEPYEGAPVQFEVSRGDILVLATDGLWDNVEDNTIEGIVEKYSADTSELCKQLVVAGSTEPYKPDDCTVVVAKV
eukprot:Rhum_TRINITY_DN12038_c0_g1::Rhum_TRINITY_DN12038_c0_g1_i1::g.48806::m.48806/K17508/PTC7, PPTC7; protein phosphatase PTC7